MSDISLVGGVPSERVEATPAERGRTTEGRIEAPTAGRPSDRADISEHARLMSRLSALPPVRTDLVASIRQQIADGTYETADRLDTAIASLLDDLQS